jgi:hypothetical protein
MNRLLARMLGRLYREEGTDDGGNGADDVKFAYHDRASWLENIASTTEGDQQFGTGTFDDEATGQAETEEEAAARVAAEAAAQAGQETPEEEAARLAEEQAAADAAAAAGVTQEQMVTLIVDGKEVTKSLSEVLDAGKRFLQKDITADERLVEATRILKEAKQVKGISETQTDTSTTTSVQDADDAELARAIQLGSDEEARDAIRKLRKSGKGDDASITSMIDARLEFREAAQWVQSDKGYADILSDSLLGGVFMQKEQEARQQGDKRPYRELYKEIGDGLRKWRDGLAPKPDALQNKQDRKSNVTVIPTARAVATVNHADEEDATDAAETQAYLADQRRRRGQA